MYAQVLFKTVIRIRQIRYNFHEPYQELDSLINEAKLILKKGYVL